ncbi:Nuclear control of ATP synthase 2 [Plasmopara halstedii]|uniref:Nuclear control of ATP synthase 2 n=1 Tax=Plasmopara halstedii TaxID=4781 RepID=A0A0N7L4J7_PLAHL|nr:Nuclear control of ATP synthase 2 [Plasmopara halstedii]CEG38867.1 Nuclear control of ATP synthase 2 [Plasmopara halstedii]|eukprot:XP_024575236.1 Nuclear control of ATP synthase 2 [Plasmopara halstedii]
MDQTTAVMASTTHEAITLNIISDLQTLGRTSIHANELARALSIVSQCYSVPVPSSAACAIPKALMDVYDLLQRNRLYANDSTLSIDIEEQREVFEHGLRLLWTHVTTYQLHAALINIVRTIDFIPRAIVFWKQLQKRRLREFLQRGPLQWISSRTQQITVEEKIRSLRETLEAHLKKIGMLKEMTTKCASTFSDYEQLEMRMKEGMALVEFVYNTNGICPPRKGHGSFKSQDPLLFTIFHFDENIFDKNRAIISTQDVVSSLQRVEKNLKIFQTAQVQYLRCFQLAMAPCRPPSKIRQRWLQVSAVAICLTAGGFWVLTNQKEFHAGIVATRAALQDFLREHMLEPLQAIFEEVVLNQKPQIQDAMALLDTKESLRRMLSDFVKDTNPKVSREEMQRIMTEMDMSVVSLQYEKQLASAVKNLMTGDIVRMLLIQVQFIKKELMVAMGAIDELMHANQLNMQIMATIPTFLVFGGLYKLVTTAFHMIYKRLSDRLFYDSNEIAGFLRNNLRDIERLLNKQNRGPGTSEEVVLGVRDLGFLILLLHQLRDLFEAYRALFQEEEQERFEEDLDDLIAEGLLVSQQLAVIQRMYHTHPFLYSTKPNKARWILD